MKEGGVSAAEGGGWDRSVTNVISMSLHGDNVDSLYGVLRYSQLLPVLLPK